MTISSIVVSVSLEYNNFKKDALITILSCSFVSSAPAGLFNTGTNALSFHLQHNIRMEERKDPYSHFRWQVPWGKHRVAARRLHHVALGDTSNQTAALPIIIIRDPFFWMQSMCHMPYAAKWKHHAHRCPNLVPTADDWHRWKHDIATQHKNASSFEVKIIFDKEDIVFWDSLVHLWSDWYLQYLHADYPRLIIRFEDMLFDAPLVISEVYQCLTGEEYPNDPPFRFQTKAAKSHGSGTDYIKAIIKTGDVEKRLHQLTPQDLYYTRDHLDPELMRLFRYSLPTNSTNAD
jgi:hypothetical protein